MTNLPPGGNDGCVPLANTKISWRMTAAPGSRDGPRRLLQDIGDPVHVVAMAMQPTIATKDQGRLAD